MGKLAVNSNNKLTPIAANCNNKLTSVWNISEAAPPASPIAQTTALPTAPTEINKIQTALELLTDEYADDYDKWIQVLFALKSVNTDSLEDQLLELWHSFSARSGKYSEISCERAWTRHRPKEGGITIASLYHWAKECNPEKYAELFPKPGITLNIIKDAPYYDPKDPYYWYDYVGEYDQKEYHFDVRDEDEAEQVISHIPEGILNEMLIKLARCARAIISSGDRYVAYFKLNNIEVFHRDLLPISMKYNRYRIRIRAHWLEDGSQRSQSETHSIYYPLYKCRELRCDTVDFIPYHSDMINIIPRTIFNIFPGFKTKLVEWTNEKAALIQPIMDHIYIVWANNNIEYYKWILQC